MTHKKFAISYQLCIQKTKKKECQRANNNRGIADRNTLKLSRWMAARGVSPRFECSDNTVLHIEEKCGLAKVMRSPGPFIHHSVSAPSIFSPFPHSLALRSLLLSGLFSGLLSTASHSPRPPTTVPLTVHTHICRDINLIAQGPAVGRALILHILVFLNKTSRGTSRNLNIASVTCLCVFRIITFYNSLDY